MKKVIAIDGPSGAGKSTIAKAVAKELNFYYLDSGSLYRTVALYFLKKLSPKVDFTLIPDEQLRKELINLDIRYEDGIVFLFSEDVSLLIRDPEVGIVTSQLSAKKIIREFLLPIQREFAKKYNTVAEGRDMTTVVFPDAWKKFYLDASFQVRAKRRYEQLLNLGKKMTFDEVLNEITERDERDATREEAPIILANDAFYIDTSELSVEDVISIILKKVAESD
jgi:cytidylate kinase